MTKTRDDGTFTIPVRARNAEWNHRISETLRSLITEAFIDEFKMTKFNEMIKTQDIQFLNNMAIM